MQVYYVYCIHEGLKPMIIKTCHTKNIANIVCNKLNKEFGKTEYFIKEVETKILEYKE